MSKKFWFFTILAGILLLALAIASTQWKWVVLGEFARGFLYGFAACLIALSILAIGLLISKRSKARAAAKAEKQAEK